MEAALRHLAERGAGRRRLAILGGMAELGEHAERHHREIAELAAELGIEVIAVGELATRRTRPRGGSRTPRPHWPRPATSSGPATPCSSRRPARSRSKASPPNWRIFPRNVPSLHSGPDRDGHLGRDRPEVHRVPAPERARPADPRGGPGRPRRQAGNARDGRPADPPLRAAALPRALAVHAAGADRPLHDRRLRRDRVPRRLHQAPPPPLAGALQGRWKLLLLAGDHRRRRDSPCTRRTSSTPRSTCRS